MKCSIAVIKPYIIPYSRNLSREKTFMNSAILEPPAKVFSPKFDCAIPTYDRFKHSRKLSLRNGHFISVRESFLLVSFLPYGTELRRLMCKSLTYVRGSEQNYS